MIELVSALMTILVLEGVLLVALNVASLILIIKQMIESKQSIKNFYQCISDFKRKVYSDEKNLNLCKAVVILYGVTKLTALWCFTILFAVVFAIDIWTLIGIILIEIMIIALQVRNKFIVDEKDVINLKWLVNKFELFVQKKMPNFSINGCCDKIKGCAQSIIKRNDVK